VRGDYMTPTMPMTTDNIYKFATLLGIALLASVVFLFLYLHEKYSEIAFNDLVELQLLKSKDNPSKEETIKINALEKKDRAMGDNILALIWGASFLAILGLFFSLRVEYAGYEEFSPNKTNYLIYRL
jgi:hypothetical protein